MDYEAVTVSGTDLVLTGVRHFVPAETLDCGQCFRWSGKNGAWRGVAYGRVLELLPESGSLVLKDVSPEEFESVWKDYLGFNRDYAELRKRFQGDAALTAAAEFSPGLRLMRQEPWETLISFILSQNNNIKRIKGMVERLCERFGKPLGGGAYAFPPPDALASLSEAELEPVRCGYRAAYIIDAAKRVASGQLDLHELRTLDVGDARLRLTEVKGVGPKVADCVLLFGYGSLGLIPKDVWMKRVLAEHYPDGFPQALNDVAGIAQQFLFHYARNGKMEIRPFNS
jgi:N-glycosylase/DNA lyase